MTTDWERTAERDPDHRDRMTAHDRAAAAMARDVPEFTDDQVCDGIRQAIAAGDFEAAVSMLHILAVQAPDKAEAIRLSIQLGGIQ